MRTILSLTLLAAVGCGVTPDDSTSLGADDQLDDPAPPPLHTQGRLLRDANNHVVKLAGVNWVGFEGGGMIAQQLNVVPLDEMAETIRYNGFNLVRLPWSNEMWERNKPVSLLVTSGQPAQHMSARDALATVVNALAAKHIYVILDNHMNWAGSCCSGESAATHGGHGLWWDGFAFLDPTDEARVNADLAAIAADANDASKLAADKLKLENDEGRLASWVNAHFTQLSAQWHTDWLEVVDAYKTQPYVIGVDLHNEPSGPACWQAGCDDPRYDWPHAAKDMGNAILQHNSKLLIIVEGLQEFGTKLQGLASRSFDLQVAHRLVYSVHEYGNGHYHRHPDGTCTDPNPDLATEKTFDNALDDQFANDETDAPVWVGEFGREHTEINDTCVAKFASCPLFAQTADGKCRLQDLWFRYFMRYLRARNLDTAYFALSGPYYGIFDPSPTARELEPGTTSTYIQAPFSEWLLGRLQTLQMTSLPNDAVPASETRSVGQ